MANINYAKKQGIENFPAAVVFAILYVPLALRYFTIVVRYIKRYTIILTLFCLARITAFTLRAILAKSERVAESASIHTVEQILISVGYFALLIASNTLVMNRIHANEEIYYGDTGKAAPSLPIRLLRNQALFFVFLLCAVVLGVTGYSINSHMPVPSGALRKSCVSVFEFLTVIQALNTILLVKQELYDFCIKYPPQAGFGARHGALILLAVVALLLLRETFSAGSLGESKTYQNEHYWYPLVATPEIICVVLYLSPGLIPYRAQ